MSLRQHLYPFHLAQEYVEPPVQSARQRAFDAEPTPPVRNDDIWRPINAALAPPHMRRRRYASSAEFYQELQRYYASQRRVPREEGGVGRPHWKQHGSPFYEAL